MSEQTSGFSVPSQRPGTDDRIAWRTYWQTLGYPWRTEPEISLERQHYLASHHTIKLDIKQGIYPFKNIQLSRADIEWLLVTREDEYGPVDGSDEQQRESTWLDLRGANLREVNLHHLPLAYMRGGLSKEEIRSATLEECHMAAVHLEKATLYETHLEGAILNYAHLEEAKLALVYLEGASLSSIHLEGAILLKIQLEGVELVRVNLEMAVLSGVHLEGANLSGANLNEARISRTHLEKANLSGADLIGADLYRIRLEKANLSEANLEGADLYGSHLEGANLRRAHMEGTYLGLVHLEAADLSEAYLEEADLYMAHLEGANLRGAHLEGADLGRASLGRSVLSTDDLERLRKWDENFPAALSPANLEGVFFDPATNLQNTLLGTEADGFAPLSSIHWSETLHSARDDTQLRKLNNEHEVWRKRRMSRTINPLMVNRRESIILRDLLRIPSVREAMEILSFTAYEEALNWINDHFKIPHGQWIDWSHDLHAVQARDSELTGEYLLRLLGEYGVEPSRRVTIVWAHNDVGITLPLSLVAQYINDTLLALADDVFLFDPHDDWCLQEHHEGEFSVGRYHRSKSGRRRGLRTGMLP